MVRCLLGVVCDNCLMFLSDVSSVKILGRALGAARRVKPSKIDGDGDGFLTGPDGRDDIPAPKRVVDMARSVVPGGSGDSSPGSGTVDGVKNHAGRRFLDLFDDHAKKMEEKFGDLRDADNVRRAVKQTFPNVKKFDWLSDGQKRLTDVEHARIVALLHLGQDKKRAETILNIGWLPEEEVKRNTNAAMLVGIIDEGEPEFVHNLLWNKDMVRPPAYIFGKNSPAGGGWGDQIAHQMVKQGASSEEIDRFWTHYIMHHEWTHVEHRAVAFESEGIPFHEGAMGLVKAVAKKKGIDDAKFAEMVKVLTEKRKAAKPNESPEELRIAVTRALVNAHVVDIKKMMDDAMNDDLSPNELRQLGPNYARAVSPYAMDNFKELVAEKSSASRLGWRLGVDNPPWKKFNSWMYRDREQAVVDTTGMSRQERRALEREMAKQNKKKDATQDFFDVSVTGEQKPIDLLVNTCTGFKHYGKITRKKSLDDISSIRFL